VIAEDAQDAASRSAPLFLAGCSFSHTVMTGGCEVAAGGGIGISH
jgi:hypothetical protein